MSFHDGDLWPDLPFALRGAQQRLTVEFGEHITSVTIERALAEAYDSVADSATVTRFVPVLVERSARDVLRQRHALVLAQQAALPPTVEHPWLGPELQVLADRFIAAREVAAGRPAAGTYRKRIHEDIHILATLGEASLPPLADAPIDEAGWMRLIGQLNAAALPLLATRHYGPTARRRAVTTWTQFADWLQAASPLAPDRPTLEGSVPPTFTQKAFDSAARAAARAGQGAGTWPARDLALLGTFAALGARTSEVLTATIEDHCGDHCITVGSANRRRELIVPEHTSQALLNYATARSDRNTSSSDALFLQADGRPMSSHAIGRTLDRLLEVGGKGYALRLRMLRSNAAYSVIRRGGGIEDLRYFLGDNRKGVADRYVRTSVAAESAGDIERSLGSVLP